MAANLGRQTKTEIATVLLERIEWQRQIERRAPARGSEPRTRRSRHRSVVRASRYGRIV